MDAREPIAQFPSWIEWSGLPAAMNEHARDAAAWMVFRKVVELDVARNGARPGTVEIAPAELAAACGVPVKRVRKALAAARALSAMRAFWPEDEAEPALFQVVVPLATPIPAGELLASRPELARCTEADLRYVLPRPDPEGMDDKVRRVADMYLDTVSMRINAFTLDELRLIAERYDLALVERVFARARTMPGRPGLGWIAAAIHREDRAARARASGEAGVG